MNLTSENPHPDPAYLVIREGGRWTDVFRLVPGRPVLIGRSSANQIVIHDDRCSRHHAELAATEEGWMLRDLDSRNGTMVDDQRLDGPHRLTEGETIAVAGCHMTFVHEIAKAFGAAEATRGADRRGATGEDQATSEGIDPSLITHRKRYSDFLQQAAGAPSAALPGNDSAAAAALFRGAFELARCETAEQAAAVALQVIVQRRASLSGAVLMLPSPAGSASPEASRLTVLAAHQPSQRSYHRLPDAIAQTVLCGGEAVLARNIEEDPALAGPDSHGQLSTTSTICAPIRAGTAVQASPAPAEEGGPAPGGASSESPSPPRVLGLIHLYSRGDQRELDSDALEFSLAVAEILALALQNLEQRRQLATRLSRTRRHVEQLKAQLAQQNHLVGDSPALQQVREQIRRAAPTASTVLLRGESGVGKELVAAALHAHSNRRDGPFVCLNCAALSPTLLESELFGHERGAFTGATDRKPGKFELADGGTLMLDEIGEMPLEIQAKFLRVLEGHRFERLGGSQSLALDVRLVAATNRDLEAAVRAGQFRADLFFRLHVLEVQIPPLRERGEDILRLADHFLERFCSETGRRLEGFSDAARQRMSQYRWPGNIRELKNAVERAVVLCAGPRIEADDLLLSNLVVPGSSEAPAEPAREAERRSDPRESIPTPPESDAEPVASVAQPVSLAELERQHILAVLRRTEGNKSRAAALLGIERSTLDRKLRRYRSG